MSELVNVSNGAKDFRGLLLATVSALALVGSIGMARADDGDRPTVWMELGGQLEQTNDAEERFAPSFILATPRPSVETVSPLSVERPPRFDNGAQAKLSFEPSGSDWVFSAAIRFGRANGDKHIHQQTYNIPTFFASNGHTYKFPKQGALFVDGERKSSESNTILDFQAGKDVGLGLFGAHSNSVFSLGVRVAQFSSSANITLKSDPDFHIQYLSPSLHLPVAQIFHSNIGQMMASRSFRGIGPSISWNASAPVLGHEKDSEIALDWGVNAAILFGRQRATVHHQTTGRYHTGKYGQLPQTTAHTATNHSRAHTITVPNIGGFAGLSFHYSIAKVSFGYRADLFLHAMDGGIDTVKKENRGFYGPFATISVGIGG